VDLRQQLAQESTSDPHPRRALAQALRALADHCSREGDYAQARRHLERGIAERRTIVKMAPGYPDDLRDFVADSSALAEALIQLGEHAMAAQTAEELATIIPEGARERLSAATLLARCIPLIDKDVRASEAQRQEMTRHYADKAMTLISDAIRLGLQDREALAQDPALAVLRSRDDFKKLVGPPNQH
jgi:tetratricopeptide (TPR) repeat protein